MPCGRRAMPSPRVRCEVHDMPELPEVETVRRGSRPVMEGARFDEVEARAAGSALAAAEGFRRAAQGPDRRAASAGAPNICSPISSSGEVLLMHLGMSGSFRVAARRRRAATPGDVPSRALASIGAHDHVVFHMSSGATRHLQRSAPLRLDEARAARRARRGAAVARRSGPSRSATRSTPRCWRAPARARRPA